MREMIAMLHNQFMIRGEYGDDYFKRVLNKK